VTRLPPQDEDEIKKQYGDYFDKAFMVSFVMALMCFAVIGRLIVGVRQRMEREKNIIEVDGKNIIDMDSE